MAVTYHLYDTPKFGICYSQLFMSIFCHYLLQNFLQVLAELAFYKSCGCCRKREDQRCSFFPFLKPVTIGPLIQCFQFDCPPQLQSELQYYFTMKCLESIEENCILAVLKAQIKNPSPSCLTFLCVLLVLFLSILRNFTCTSYALAIGFTFQKARF